MYVVACKFVCNGKLGFYKHYNVFSLIYIVSNNTGACGGSLQSLQEDLYWQFTEVSPLFDIISLFYCCYLIL